MTENIQKEKSLGEQMVDLLNRNPGMYDVTFTLGPDKKQVKAVKFILVAASPVFEREFVDNWDGAVMQDGEGIPLLDIDPTVFQLFFKLLTLDAWGVDAVKSRNLSPDMLLSLLRLCHRFEITKAIKNMEELADEFIQDFRNFRDTDEFLGMDRENMEIIFKSEEIPLDEKEIFECACRWAEHHCKQSMMELTGENFGKVLGGCLFQIRFPIMNFEDFSGVSRFKIHFLADDVKLAIYDFIGMTEVEKAECDRAMLPFNTHPRVRSSSFGVSVLRLTKQFQTAIHPPLVCDGDEYFTGFQVSKKILLHGIGFLGPFDAGTHYDVCVQIRRMRNGSWTFDSGVFSKNLFARKGKVFHFLFDNPIKIKPNEYDSSWNNYYYIEYSLKGKSSLSYLNVGSESPEDETMEMSGVEFTIKSEWFKDGPVAELLYTRM